MKSTPVKGLRHFARVPFAADVQLQLQGHTLSVHLIDIALKGALVQLKAPHAIALQETCSLMLPLSDGGEGVEMAGKVVHLEGDHVGIECQDIDVASLTRLRRLIELNTGDPDIMNRELRNLFHTP